MSIGPAQRTCLAATEMGSIQLLEEGTGADMAPAESLEVTAPIAERSVSKGEDFIDEIIQRRGELPPAIQYQLASSELRRLKTKLEACDHNASELPRLAPIRVVACMEGCLKAAATELINHGAPYLQRAGKLPTHLRLDFDILTAVLTERVTVGEMVAHSLTWQSLEAIDSTMSTLLSCKFFASLRLVRDRSHIDEHVIVKDLDRMLSVLAETIRIRQVLCHEVASSFDLKLEDALEMLECGWQFTYATSQLVSEVLSSNAPPNVPTRPTDAATGGQTEADTPDSQLPGVLRRSGGNRSLWQALLAILGAHNAYYDKYDMGVADRACRRPSRFVLCHDPCGPCAPSSVGKRVSSVRHRRRFRYYEHRSLPRNSKSDGAFG